MRVFHDISHQIHATHLHQHDDGQEHAHAHTHSASHESDSHNHVIEENQIQLFLNGKVKSTLAVNWIICIFVEPYNPQLSNLRDQGIINYRSTSPPGKLVTQLLFYLPSHTAPPSTTSLV